MALRKDIKCEYSQPQNAAAVFNTFRVDGNSRGDSLNSPFPGSFFIDYDVYRDAQLWLPRVDLPLPPEVTGYVSDMEFIVSQHFATTQSWMPIISKKKIYRELADKRSRHQSDFTILLYCMKLLMWWPAGRDRYTKIDPRTAAYSTATRLLHEAEAAGTLTLQLLQAKLLVSLYELGHGIYPAAYLSVGSCARYGTALGIDRTNEASQSNYATGSVDLEEMRRCWWAIIILDRSETFPCKCTPMFLPSTIFLPIAQNLSSADLSRRQQEKLRSRFRWFYAPAPRLTKWHERIFLIPLLLTSNWHISNALQTDSSTWEAQRDHFLRESPNPQIYYPPETRHGRVGWVFRPRVSI